MPVTIPEDDVAKIKRYCESVVPDEHLDRMKVQMKRRGKSVTILECSPLWSGVPGSDWMEVSVAQLRYDETAAGWSLYWADRNSRWHPYELIEPHQPVDVLLDEIERDPTCIFWG